MSGKTSPGEDVEQTPAEQEARSPLSDVRAFLSEHDFDRSQEAEFEKVPEQFEMAIESVFGAVTLPSDSAADDPSREFRCVECKTVRVVDKPGIEGSTQVVVSCSECRSTTVHKVTEGSA